jgi:phosphonate transport system substrate-binding protein
MLSNQAKRAGRRKEVPRGTSYRSPRPLRIVTFLAPNLFWFYEFVCRYLESKIRYPAELCVGTDYAQLGGRADIAFVCGLPYVEHARSCLPAIEPLAAPVLTGPRYHGRPIYFSDVIVARRSPFWSFQDLRGRSWAYNEPHSQSGYGIVRHRLMQQGETFHYFSQLIETGYHERSVQMVSAGEVDASAIDSHVLATLMLDNVALSNELRIIDTFGPSPIQPVVAASHLSESLKRDVRAALVGMSADHFARRALGNACIDRFVAVSDRDYSPIRKMLASAETCEDAQVCADTRLPQCLVNLKPLTSRIT